MARTPHDSFPTGLIWDLLPRRFIEVLPTMKQVIAGGLAGCVAKTAVAPLSRVTVLMQVQSMRPHKFTDGKTPNNQPEYGPCAQL
ncbi:sodA [Symbiodinium natans]|uniref:SodA protein n=1 Tax=Symbiodinium natans TaxID=878477 RepID=A0A812RXF6_9DINO|nr:sodA [Symbiodinium natans]